MSVLVPLMALAWLVPNEALLPPVGPWGWAQGGALGCEGNHHFLEYRPDVDELHLRYREAADFGDQGTTNRVVYDVLSIRPGVLTLALRKETRVDAAGHSVTWHLIYDSDSYCWQRSDWGAGDCTADILRCELPH